MPHPTQEQRQSMAVKLAKGASLKEAAQGVMNPVNLKRALKVDRYGLRNKVLEEMEKQGVDPANVVRVLAGALKAGKILTDRYGVPIIDKNTGEVMEDADHRTRLLAAKHTTDIMGIEPPKQVESTSYNFAIIDLLGLTSTDRSANPVALEEDADGSGTVLEAVFESDPEAGRIDPHDPDSGAAARPPGSGGAEAEDGDGAEDHSQV